MEKVEKKVRFIAIIDDRLWRSVASDAFTFFLGIGITGFGWLLSSSAMQWVGFVVFFLVIFARASMKGKTRLTTQEAADFLRDEYGVTAGPTKEK